MRTVRKKGKVVQEPTMAEECEYLLCLNCNLLNTSECFKCTKSAEKIKKLERQIAKLKKKIILMEEAAK